MFEMHGRLGLSIVIVVLRISYHEHENVLHVCEASARMCGALSLMNSLSTALGQEEWSQEA